MRTPMSTVHPPAPASERKTTAASYALPGLGGQYHFLFRRLHSLTGIVFGGYIIVHLLVNATLLEGSRYSGGASVFQQQVDKIHALPWLILVEWVAIYLPLIYHTVYGIWIALTGQPNAGSYGYLKNWFYVAQRISAIILVFFILFHVLSMKIGGSVFTFVPIGLATESTGAHLQSYWWVGWLVYPVGILAATFHLSNGFWTAAITWGLTTTKAAQHRWGLACAGLFLFTTVCGFAALIGGLGVDVTEQQQAQLDAAQRDPHQPEGAGTPGELMGEAGEEALDAAGVKEDVDD